MTIPNVTQIFNALNIVLLYLLIIIYFQIVYIFTRVCN